MQFVGVPRSRAVEPRWPKAGLYADRSEPMATCQTEIVTSALSTGQTILQKQNTATGEDILSVQAGR